jgi:hypothetical protein
MSRKPAPKRAQTREISLSWLSKEEADDTRRDFSERAEERKTARQQIEAFIRRQAEMRRLVSFADLARLYADASKSEPYGEREQRAYRELKKSLLTGGFRRQGVLCVWAIHEGLGKERCEVLGEKLPAFVVADEILQQFRGDPDLDHPERLIPWIPSFWGPTDLCCRWLTEHGIEPPNDWVRSIASAECQQVKGKTRRPGGRGRKLIDSIKQRMRADIRGGGAEELRRALGKALPQSYGASRNTCTRARDEVFEEFCLPPVRNVKN